MKLPTKIVYLVAGAALVVLFALAAAGALDPSNDSDGPEAAVTCVIGTVDCNDTVGLGDDPGELDVATGIDVLHIEGVTVFQHDPEGWDDALHTGIADIGDGCLLVDGAAIVWHADSINQAMETIAAVQRGESPTLTLGGGGSSIDEDGNIPSVITDNCNVATVWFTSP